MTQNLNTDYAVAPGALLDEWLAENSMTQAGLASRLGRSVKNVNQVVNGVAPLSHELALDLESVTGVPARLWLNMESQYREDRARLSREQVTVEQRAWLQSLPLGHLRRRGVLSSTMHQSGRLLQESLAFFRVASIDAFRAVYADPCAQYRQSAAYQADSMAILSWLRLGEIAAAEVPRVTYRAEDVWKLLPTLRSLSAITDRVGAFEQLRAQLAAVGVILVIVEDVPGTRLYGATRWISGSPVVQLSLRRKTDDQFWFTLFHEIGHVLLHGHDQVFVDFSGLESDVEEQANKFACDLLIPIEHVRRLSSLRSLDDVRGFAAEIGVSPGVVVGRMHYERLRAFSWGAGLKKSIDLSQ